MHKSTNVGILAKVTAQYFFYKVYFMYLLYILCIGFVTGIMLKRCLCVTCWPYWNRRGKDFLLRDVLIGQKWTLWIVLQH